MRKLTWSARALGPSGGTSVHHTPSRLLRLRGKHLRSHEGNTPAFGFSACHLLAFVGLCLKMKGMRIDFGNSGPLGPGEMDYSLLCFGESLGLSGGDKCLRGPKYLTWLHTCVPMLWGFLWQQYPSFVTSVPPAPAPTSRSLLSKTRTGIISLKKLPYSPSSPGDGVYLGHGSIDIVAAQ